MKETEKIACEIVEVFDEFLRGKEIKIKCSNEFEENDRKISEKEEGNDVSIYGSEYWNLVFNVNGILNFAERKDIIIHNLLQELYEKVFDCQYDLFYQYITLEAGITDDDIEKLKENDNYIVTLDDTNNTTKDEVKFEVLDHDIKVLNAQEIKNAGPEFSLPLISEEIERYKSLILKKSINNTNDAIVSDLRKTLTNVNADINKVIIDLNKMRDYLTKEDKK